MQVVEALAALRSIEWVASEPFPAPQAVGSARALTASASIGMGSEMIQQLAEQVQVRTRHHCYASLSVQTLFWHQDQDTADKSATAGAEYSHCARGQATGSAAGTKAAVGCQAGRCRRGNISTCSHRLLYLNRHVRILLYYERLSYLLVQ